MVEEAKVVETINNLVPGVLKTASVAQGTVGGIASGLRSNIYDVMASQTGGQYSGNDLLAMFMNMQSSIL